MAVTRCYICEQNPDQARRLGNSGFENGLHCPICHRPTCRHHLVTVRWRWRTPTREVDSAFICRECKRTYRHRDWDAINREWIS
jgi:uncharacterized protein YbaR (Trm112 family)